MNGISQSLKDTLATIRTWTNVVTFEELHEQLIEHEAYLGSMDSSSYQTVVIAHVMNKTHVGPSSFSCKVNWNNWSNFFLQYQ